MNFKIDPEFQSWLPKQSDDTRTRLKEKIECDGCLPGALTVAKIGNERILIDGHHTLEICRELDIEPPEQRVKEFPTREAAKLWMLGHQLARRNTNDHWVAYAIGELFNAEKAEHGDPKRFEGSQGLTGEALQKTQGKTAEVIGEQRGMSKATVERNGQFAAAVDATAAVEGPKAREAILSGETGQTRKEVVANAPQLCAGCQRRARTGQPAVKNCPDCRDIVNTTRPYPDKKPRTVKPPKPGSVKFDWKDWHSAFGKMYRSIDSLYHGYGPIDANNAIRPDAEYHALQLLLQQFYEQFRTRYRELAKQEPPEH